MQRNKSASQNQRALDQSLELLPCLPSRAKKELWGGASVSFQYIRPKYVEETVDKDVDIVAELLTARRRKGFTL